jgi:DNA-binding NarL/FixJ family response regulator
MAEMRLARLPGRRPGADGARPNGLPETATRGYRRFGDPDWDPWLGRHHEDPSVAARSDAPRGPGVTPGRAAIAASVQAQQDRRDARVAECARLLADGLKVKQVATRVGVSESTVRDYQRILRDRDGAT